MDLGFLVLRIVLGLLLAGHGAQKLFGWFGGYGIDGTSGWLQSIGFRPARPLAVAAGASEFAGGLLIAAGLFTPLGAAAVIGTMLTAAFSVHGGKGPWASEGGWELTVTNAAAAAALAFAGPGRWSLDALAGLELSGLEWGIAAVALGAAGSLLTLALRRRQVRVAAAPEASTAQAA